MSEVEIKTDYSDEDKFLYQLKVAKELLEIHGETVGLCPKCLDTGYLYIQKDDGYTGIQAMLDNELSVPVRCFHDTSADDGNLPF